jgi:hypothetical protein
VHGAAEVLPKLKISFLPLLFFLNIVMRKQVIRLWEAAVHFTSESLF